MTVCYKCHGGYKAICTSILNAAFVKASDRTIKNASSLQTIEQVAVCYRFR